MRLGELGTVYRYERSGVMHGLLRVRGFTQDDAHIFCTPEQIEKEIADCVEFARRLLKTSGLTSFKRSYQPGTRMIERVSSGAKSSGTWRAPRLKMF